MRRLDLRSLTRQAVLLALMITVRPALAWQAAQEAVPQVTVVFSGNTQVSDSTLRRELVDPLVDINRRGARPADVDDAAYELSLYYLDNGFAFATVTWSIEEIETGNDVGTGTGRKLVTLTIDEGTQVLVQSISFLGNAAIDSATLAALYQAPATGFLGGGEKIFVQSRVNNLAGDIESLYRGEGYDEVQVARPTVTFNEDRSRASIHAVVTEGPLFVVEDISYSGNELVPDEDVDSVITPLVGQSYRRRLLFDLRIRVENLLADQGFPAAEVDVEEVSRDPSGMVSLDVVMREGERVTIGQVLIEGQEQTDEDFIRDRIPFQPGDQWNGSIQREVSRNLLATGLFRSVSVQLAGDGPVRDFVVRVEDAKSIELYVKPGYGAYEQARLSVGIRENNLFGTGRSANFEVGASTKGEFAQLTFSDPWLLGENRVLSVPFRYQRREEPSFTELTRSVGVLVRKRWSANLSTTLGVEYEQTTISDVDPTVTQELKEDSQVTSIFGRVRHDTRDLLFNPTTGHVRTLFLQYGTPTFGADLEFVRAEGSVSHYWPFGEHVVLAASARSGFILPTGGTDEIPLQYRFFNGGESTVRSFKYSELGPKDARGEPLGGEVANTVNLEYRYNWTQAWQTALFYDYGNVGLTTSDYFDDFRSGVGGGVRYLLPVGSVRCDLGVNPSPRQDEDRWVAQVAIGMAF